MYQSKNRLDLCLLVAVWGYIRVSYRLICLALFFVRLGQMNASFEEITFIRLNDKRNFHLWEICNEIWLRNECLQMIQLFHCAEHLECSVIVVVSSKPAVVCEHGWAALTSYILHTRRWNCKDHYARTQGVNTENAPSKTFCSVETLK